MTACCGRCAGQSGIFLDNKLGNRVLDSLKSRAEWEKSYRLLYTQYLLAKNHVDDLDSTSVTVNAHCDSLVKNGLRRENELITENTGLRTELTDERNRGRDAKTERWVWRILAGVALVLTVTSK